MDPLPPLPPCDGPKLAPFAQNFEDLTFEPEIVIKDEDTYAHGLIIKAKLNGETYCIKFFVKKDLGSFFNPKHYPDLNDDEIALARMQSDPFHTECRAYGRLKEAGQEHLAAKAYGYIALFVNEKTKEMFKPAIDLVQPGVSMVDFMLHWDHGPDTDWKFVERPESEPIYGIVKEWVGGEMSDKLHDEQYSWNRSDEEVVAACHQRIENLPKMLEGVEGLHRNGIVIRDIHQDQWIEGKLVDLSSSWTFPHVLGQGDRYRPDWSFASFAARDLYEFQDMIDSENECLDRADAVFSHADTLPSSKKSTLVAYPRHNLEAPVRRVKRDGLRPLPHRREPQLRPLLLYHKRYDPDSTERGPNFVPWTYGPRYDPTHYVPPENREEGTRQPAKTRTKDGRKPSRRNPSTKGKAKTASKMRKVSKTTRKVARKN